MQSVNYVRDEDRPAAVIAQEADHIIDPSPFIGTWITTNNATRGIVKIEVADDGGALLVHAFGACSPAPCDWGEVKAAVFADTINSTTGLAFSASYDFRFMQSDLQAKIKKGVLVVASFNHFKDESGRSDYFSREFFYRDE